ncbi:MAG: hypothetical protein PHO10_07085 [Gemmiger sp.]|nr:hypothetical protein [Gemmiger sp.]
MDQNFSLMAQSRANYYTAGSPVQFVRVELLKGDATGEVAVCLTFKNVGTEPMTGLVIHFKCKDPAGQVLCEDDFYYEDLNVAPGGLFGTDDAVYVSDTPVSSVEIEQDRAFLNGRGVDLRGYKRVRLQTPRMLPGPIAKQLQSRTGNTGLIAVPQDTDQGWFCACGAFHPNEENAQTCSECGGDRAFVKAALTSILEEARQAAEQQQREISAVAGVAAPPPAAPAPTRSYAPPPPVDEPTRAIPAEENNPELERVRQYSRKAMLYDDVDDEDEEGTQMFDSADDMDDDTDELDAPKPRASRKQRGRYADDEAESDDDVVAERIIRWAPPITAIVCAVIIAVALIYHFVIAA